MASVSFKHALESVVPHLANSPTSSTTAPPSAPPSRAPALRGQAGPGAATRQRILDAAEALFADQGVASTSLRAIIAAAGVNSAAIHYHFGSKEALIGAFLARRITPVHEARMQHLDRLEAAGQVDHESLVRAWLEPLLGDGTTRGSMGWSAGAALARLLSEDPASFRAHAEPRVADARRRFAQALVAVTPGLDLDEASERLHFAMGALLHAFAQIRSASGATNDIHARMRMLIPFLAAGFSAPPGSKTTAPRPREH